MMSLLQKLVKKLEKVNWFLFLLVTSHPYVLYFRGTHFNITITLPYNWIHDVCKPYAPILMCDELNGFGLSDICK